MDFVLESEKTKSFENLGNLGLGDKERIGLTPNSTKKRKISIDELDSQIPKLIKKLNINSNCFVLGVDTFHLLF